MPPVADSSPADTKRVRLAGDERRRQILHAASEQFADRPYSQVSISDIAEAAGVARGLLHHYFESKRDLYLEVVRRIVRVPTASFAADTPGSWERAVDGLLGLIAADPDRWLRFASLGGSERDDDLEGILDDSREVVAAQTIQALGIADDQVTPELRAIVRGYGGFVQELTLEWLVRGRLDRAQVREALVRTMPLLLADVLPHLRD